MKLALAIILINFLFVPNSKSAAVLNKDHNKLDLIKEDIVEIGNTINNFAFDLLEDVFEVDQESETDNKTIIEDSSKTNEIKRSKRDVTPDEEAAIRKLCQKHFGKSNTTCNLNLKEIKSLKEEMVKLQDVLQLISEQQAFTVNNIDNALEEKNFTVLQVDLDKAISNLNQTKDLLEAEKLKSETLEDQLKKQQHSLDELKTTVEILITNTTEDLQHDSLIETHNLNNNNNTTSSNNNTNNTTSTKHNRSRSDSSETSLNEIETKIVELRNLLANRRKQQQLLREMRELENKVKEGNNEFNEVPNLNELQDAIDHLRPKEEVNNDWQQMLRKLWRQQEPKKVNIDSRFPPYICFVDTPSQSQLRQIPTPQKPQEFMTTPRPVTSQQPPPPNLNYFPQNFNQRMNRMNRMNVTGTSRTSGATMQQDLLPQIDALQRTVDFLHERKPEEKVALGDLQSQINYLRSIFTIRNGRNKRSTEDNNLDDTSEMLQNMTQLVGKIIEKVDGQQLPDNDKGEIESKIDSILKQQLESIGSGSEERAAKYPYTKNYQQISTYSYDSGKQLFKDSGKKDFLTDLIARIIEKVIAAIPLVLNKVFNFSLENLGSYDYGDSGLGEIFKNLGVFGYIPAIFLRHLSGLSAFLGLLKKNKFFKTFLLPAIILAVVAGSVLFLIWWLQPDDLYNNYGSNNYESNSNSYSDNNYSANQSPYSANYRSYPTKSSK